MVALSNALKGAVLCAVFFSATAQAVTIDFEDGDRSFVRQSQDENACIDNFTVQHNGFTFDNQRDCGAYYEYFDGAVSDNMALFFATSGSYTTTGGRGPSWLEMTSTNGSLFNLLSLDLVIGAENFVDAYGYRDGNLVYEQLLTIDSGFVQNQQLNFLGVDTIVFSQQWPRYNSLGLDNLVVTAVPVPAAVWLFGSALAGLGWLRRPKQHDTNDILIKTRLWPGFLLAVT